jgi:hypothetical protein
MSGGFVVRAGARTHVNDAVLVENSLKTEAVFLVMCDPSMNDL